MTDEVAVATPEPEPAPAPFILEADRRWADFRGGRPILLPDGQEWHFHEPAAVIRDGKAGWTFNAPSDIDAILSHRFGRILAKWTRAADDGERASVVLEASWFLLACNYCLTQAEYESILADMDAYPDEWQAGLMGELMAPVGVALARAAGLAEATSHG
jgi:hypothetical protein